jgi:hypothetical protein
MLFSKRLIVSRFITLGLHSLLLLYPEHVCSRQGLTQAQKLVCLAGMRQGAGVHAVAEHCLHKAALSYSSCRADEALHNLSCGEVQGG